jgi:DNA-binding MarR family transcriptional regulator
MLRRAHVVSAGNLGVMSTTETPEARTEAVRALEVEFSELLNRVRRIIAANAARVSPDMLPGAYKVFTTIVGRERVTQSELTELLMADKGQISRMVRDLENLELIERTPDPTDRRSSILSATAHGRERLAAARKPQEDSLLNALAEWDVDDIRSLAHLLHALTAGVTPSATED